MDQTFNPSILESQAFNLCTEKVETKRDMAGWEKRIYHWKRQELITFSLRIHRDGILPIQSEY